MGSFYRVSVPLGSAVSGGDRLERSAEETSLEPFEFRGLWLQTDWNVSWDGHAASHASRALQSLGKEGEAADHPGR